MKQAGQVLVGLFGGLLFIAIGAGIGGGAGTGVALFGVVAMVAASFTLYKEIKTKKVRKQIARDEAEIRAHQLRQARGQV